MENLTPETFKTKVLESKEPVLVDFNADWCGPCQAQAPILEELSADHPIFSVNVDDQPDLAAEYGVSGIPCLVLFKDGAEITRKTGLQSKSTITKLFKE